MNQERKVSVLRNLLERVQKRATAPRAVSAAVATVSAAPAPAVTSPPIAISVPPAQPVSSSGRPGAGTLPLDFHTRPEAASLRPSVHEAVTSPPLAPMASMAERERELEHERQRAITSTSAFSDAPTSVPGEEEDEGPPSAPRLREAPEIEVAVEEEEVDEPVEEHEPQLKTPPPESGRQHVTPGPSVAVSEAEAEEEDGSITVTMEESEVPPLVAAAVQEVSISASRAEVPEPPTQRLALVSEPEIELHGMTPLSSAIVEPIAPAKPAEPAAAKPPPAPEPLAAKTPTPAPVAAKPAPQPIAAKAEPEPSARSAPSVRPMDLDFAMPSAPPPAPTAAPAAPPAPSVPAPTPSGVRPSAVAPPAAPVAAAPAPPLEAAPPAPPVRMMVQPLADSGKPLPPVEVWASTFTPALKGEVAAFVHHNAEAAPKTFGELVRASVALGEEKS